MLSGSQYFTFLVQKISYQTGGQGFPRPELLMTKRKSWKYTRLPYDLPAVVRRLLEFFPGGAVDPAFDADY